MNQKAIATVAATIALGLAAKADTQQFTTSYQNTTDWSHVLQLQQFDPSLGTLTGVSIQFIGSTLTSGTVTNTSAVTYQNGSTCYSESLFELGNSALDNAIIAQIGNANGITANSILDLYRQTSLAGLAPGQVLTINNLSATGPVGNQTATFNNASSVWNSFIGTGNFSLDGSTFTSSTTTIVPGGNDVGISLSGTANLQSIVTYTYTPVPEPSTMAMAVAGGLGLLFLRRRK
ncbi:MAG TPA: PEP-CTERM sorting domain-containing protein [Verrucomicrobiae bacterium]